MTLSIDTNVLVAAIDDRNLSFERARRFIRQLEGRSDVVLSELMLVELYGLLRNPTVMQDVMSSAQAVAAIEAFRNHPRWQVVGIPQPSRQFHDKFWARLGEASFARRRAYDWRMALSLVEQGVDEFTTVNLDDFAGFGFRRVWNPLAEG